MPKYNPKRLLRIKRGVMPMDSHGVVVRCKVHYDLLSLMQFTMVFDAYDRIDDGGNCIEYHYLIPEIDVEGYIITKIEILRSVHIGKKLIEHVCARTEEGFEHVVELGEPAMIIFQDPKLASDTDET